MAVREVGLTQTFGGSSGLLLHHHVVDPLPLPFGQGRRQSGRRRIFGRTPHRVQALPPQLDRPRAAGVEVIVVDSGDGGGGRGDPVVVPSLKEATADQVVDPIFFGAQVHPPGIEGGRDDRVVIADLSVVDEAAPQRSSA
jgi:hypothetical protein